jgi:histone H3/H4
MKVYKGSRKKKQEDMSETLTKAGIERLLRGVSKTNIGDIEDLKFAKQLKTELKKKDIKKWLLDTGRSLKKKLLRS